MNHLQHAKWIVNLTPAAKVAGIFIARKALDMVSFGQRFGVVEKHRFTTFLLLLAASICRILPRFAE